MHSAIIFDFDGTIANTLHAARLVLNSLADEYDFEKIPADEVDSMRGFTVNALVKHLGIKRRHVPILLAKGTKLLRSHIEDIDPCIGIPEIIPQMRQHSEHFGILTSNSVENVEAFLEKHDLRNCFTFISSTSKLKGKSKHLKAIARTFSVTPQSMLYIGDEMRDMKAASKALVPSVAVTWGFNSQESLAQCSPTHLVNHPNELLKIF